jgi:hypothetical protein
MYSVRSMQVDTNRIISTVRQAAFLVHVSDNLGASAEQVCQQLVFHGRLSFHAIVGHVGAEGAAGEEEEGSTLVETCAKAVHSLMQGRFIEQARCSLQYLVCRTAFSTITSDVTERAMRNWRIYRVTECMVQYRQCRL